MEKKNKAITAMDRSGSFRVYMAITTKMADDARKIHGTSPLATHLLGRALTGAGLMGLMLREPGFKLTLQFRGEGPAQQVLCTAYSDERSRDILQILRWIFRRRLTAVRMWAEL